MPYVTMSDKSEALNQKGLVDTAGLALLQGRMSTCSLKGPCEGGCVFILPEECTTTATAEP